MKLKIGDKLPGANMSVMGANGPEMVDFGAALAGRKTVVFGLPGAFTGDCTMTHIPSFMRVIDQLKAKGIEDVYCVAVNDPFVMSAWGEQTGATAAGIKLMGDADASFTKAIGAAFTVPAIGFYDRCGRFAALVDDGVITVLNIDAPGVCDISTGERFLEAL